MSRHTPGPWEPSSHSAHADCDGAIYVRGGELVAHVSCRDHLSEAFANTRLIAAAPELLEALKMCDELLRGLPDSGGFYGLAVLEASEAAIKAAGGDS